MRVSFRSFLRAAMFISLGIISWWTLNYFGMLRISEKDYRSFKLLIKVIFSVYLFTIGVGIFLKNKNPSSTISWLIVFIEFPIWGFLMYLMFGRSFNRERIAKLKAKFRTEKFKTNVKEQQKYIEREIEKNPIIISHKKLAKLLLKNSESLIFKNNKTKVFTCGEKQFQSLIKDIRNAKHHINLEYFIIKDDKTGVALKNALISKAQQGVEVRVLYDAVGSFRLKNKYIQKMKKYGIKFEPFLPVLFPTFGRELNYRNHRKIVVVDGSIAYIGGMNIGDEYRGINPRFESWRDTHMRIEGDAVAACQRCFMMDWAFATGEFLSEDKYIRTSPVNYYQPMQIAICGPDTKWESIMQAFLSLISSAHDNIRITTPYLIPDKSIMDALKTAALSGVNVEIIIPAKPDHFFAFWATRSNLKPLVESGVKVYQYTKGFIHSKTIVIDSAITTIGSTNLDYRSMELNFEINAFIYDEDMARTMEKIYVEDLAKAERITLQELKDRPFYHRIFEAFGKIVSPLQ